jgi:5'(3')-deoxyribonucleotidase
MKRKEEKFVVSDNPKTWVKALLDMDGVLCNFASKISEAHNRPSPYLLPENYGKWDMEKIWGMDEEEFQRPTKNIPFWAEMEEMPEARELVKKVVELFGGEENVGILTTPTQSPECLVGKRIWVKEHFPSLAGRVFYGRDKKFFSLRGMWLFDDRDKNVDEFNTGEGRGVLIPQLWNSRWREVKGR